MIPALKDWGGEQLVVHLDPPSGAWIFIAIHSTKLGTSTAGGTRMKQYETPEEALEDVLRLSAAMTFKLALAEVAFGGGKAVIALERPLEPAARAALLRRYGERVAQLGGLFHTGPDMGTTSEDMNIIAETGAPYVHSRTPEAGGAGDSGPGTAVGVLAGIETTAAELGLPLAGLRVLVQGAGGVGGPLIEMLCEIGADVRFSDVSAAVAERFPDLPRVPVESVYQSECDIFAPCAMGGILNAQTIALLRCKAIVGSANNQLASEADAERLQERGILYAPDMVVNLGGLMSVMGLEEFGWSREEGYSRIRATVDRTLREVYAQAKADRRSPHFAARTLAEQRLSAD